LKDHGYKSGWLGSYSGINPLVTACKYALRAAEVAIMGLLQQKQELASEIAAQPAPSTP
jgi:hypothetical protein